MAAPMAASSARSARADNSSVTRLRGNAPARSPTASATDHELRCALGNIGHNLAAGVGNAQSNALAASVNSSGNVASASADSEQLTEMNDVVAGMDLDNTASLSGSALSAAVGNIGVNIAAGVGNAQHNGLSIAVASCGTCN